MSSSPTNATRSERGGQARLNSIVNQCYACIISNMKQDIPLFGDGIHIFELDILSMQNG